MPNETLSSMVKEHQAKQAARKESQGDRTYNNKYYIIILHNF